jgi:Zn-dependent protease
MEIAIISISILVFSVILHEVAHGYMADSLGDPTARNAGRLTLNPIPHIDPYGSILLPAMLAFTHAPIMIGWANPVPYNPHNIRNAYGDALVALAGPATNFLLALIFGLIIRTGVGAGDMPVLNVLYTVVHVNVMLGLFNCLPIPPLDGSKILTAFLPRSLLYPYERFLRNVESNPLLGMGAIVVFVMVFGGLFDGVVMSVTRAIIGV